MVEDMTGEQRIVGSKEQTNVTREDTRFVTCEENELLLFCLNEAVVVFYLQTFYN